MDTAAAYGGDLTAQPSQPKIATDTAFRSRLAGKSKEWRGVTICVFVQNEAGSSQKNYHDEKTLAFRHSRVVSHAYPFAYGFIIGTEADDECSVDCFVITDRVLRTGQIVECEPIGLMEQFEDGVEDHNVLARPLGESWDVTGVMEAALTEHVLACFRHVEGKKMRVGRFLGVRDAEAYVVAHLNGTPRLSGRLEDPCD